MATGTHTADAYVPFITSAAKAYGFDPAVELNVGRRESGLQAVSKNTTDSNAAAGHPSEGMFQFIEPTFNAYSAQAKAANPAAWQGVKTDWHDWRAQALTAAWAMANGKGNAWSTFGKAKQDAKTGAGLKPDGSATLGAATGTTGTGFDGRQKAALAMLFDGDPLMQKLIGLRATQAQTSHVIAPTAEASTALATGGGGGKVGQQLVATALAQVGTTANDAMRYIKAAGGTGYEPWCGDFVTWVFKQRGLKPPPARSVPQLMAWAKKNQRLTNNPRAGDLVTFDWNGDGVADHVELVTGKVKGGVTTVGGNTSGGKGGSQVAAKTRTSNILGYVEAA